MRLGKHNKGPGRSPELFDEDLLKKLEYLHLVARKIASDRTRAERRSRRLGAGIEFADHRDYAAGDDFRYVDWKVLGRTDRLLLRLFEQEEDLTISFLLDVSNSMLLQEQRKLRYALRVVAALAYIGLAGLDRVGVVTIAGGIVGRLPAARGKARIFKVLEFLRSAACGGRTDLTSSARDFVREHKRRGLVLLVSDFYDVSGSHAALDILRHNRCEPYAIQIYDREEANPQISGDVRLVDCESGDERDLTISAAMLERYRQRHAAFCRQLEEFCRAKHVPFARADTHVPFDELVLTILRQKGFAR